MSSVPRLQAPPGQPTPYIIPNFEGEIFQIPGTKGAVRILASSKETEGTVAVFRMDGVGGEPVGFHYHNLAHDVFLCSKGHLQVWAGDKARELSPGDFAYVPPKVVHRPKLVGNWTETVGLITPSDWIDFFRFISEPYSGVMADESDDRNPQAALGAKVEEIKKRDFDVVMAFGHQACEIGVWDEKEDSVLPDAMAPYFLKANSGPCWVLGGVLARPFITTKQNGGRFAIASIESSSVHAASNAFGSKTVAFAKTHHAFMVLDGRISLTLQGSGEEAQEVRTGETVFIPAGQGFAVSFPDKYVRFWSFSSGDGIESVIMHGGERHAGQLLPDKAAGVDGNKLTDALAAVDAAFV